MKTLRGALLAALLLWAGAGFAVHPPVVLLGPDGESVLRTGQPVSTVQSCCRCHDTRYIATHSYHAWLGADEQAAVASGRPWDWGLGPLGRWNPLTYRHVVRPDDSRFEQTLAEWIATFPRHVGGGPASSDVVRRRVEMNCFLCHTSQPDNAARIKELRDGRFEWANTATLASTGLVRPAEGGWAYRPEAFLADGRLDARRLTLREPRSENCGLCHGAAGGGEEPLKVELSLRNWSTATKGQVFSPQRISEAAVNLRDKDLLARPWDIHAERLLECTSCHYSLNDPAFYEPDPKGRPKHLKFDPRRPRIAQYLQQPSHQFAKGQSSQGMLAQHLADTMRRCEDCHRAADTHDWLPYRETHFSRLSCEACHIPRVYAPAVQKIDWTLLTPSGEPQVEWRGIEGDPADPTAQVTSFRPVLLPSKGRNGRTRLVPHNLVSAWYWVEGGAAPRPVPRADLERAMLSNGKYHPEIAAAIGGGPASLESPEQVEAVRRRLEAVGLTNPRIEAEIQPYSLHHGVGPAKWATRKCEACHRGDSRLGEPFTLASATPGGILPKPVGDSGAKMTGQIGHNGPELTYEPSTRQASLYVLGHDRWLWVHGLGGASFLAVVLGVIVHAGFRVRVARRKSTASRSQEAPQP